MLYFLGFVLAGFLFVAGFGYFITRVHKTSQWRPQKVAPSVLPSLGARAIISFSLITPFVALAFLVLTFPSMDMVHQALIEGHILFILSSLVLPTFCFLLGYLYLRRVAQ